MSTADNKVPNLLAHVVCDHKWSIAFGCFIGWGILASAHTIELYDIVLLPGWIVFALWLGHVFLYKLAEWSYNKEQ